MRSAAQVSHVDVQLPARVGAAGHRAAPRRAGICAGSTPSARAPACPAGVVLNPRWSQECAAHDAYEQANGVLTPHREPAGAGRIAGRRLGRPDQRARAVAVDAGRPTRGRTRRSICMQLFSPSLSVVGIDDGGGLQCATTYPGLLRAPGRRPTRSSPIPADGTRGVPPSEKAREAPFVPGQFVGIPAGRTTGRDLFVYLNQAGQTGQAQVKVLRATLSVNQRPVAIKSVDNSTRTVGQYLTGAILIPVSPLRPRTTYHASVDRSGPVGRR